MDDKHIGSDFDEFFEEYCEDEYEDWMELTDEEYDEEYGFYADFTVPMPKKRRFDDEKGDERCRR